MAATVSQAWDRLQRFPETTRSRQVFDRRTNRFDGVSILEDWMPLRNHASSLGKQKKQDSVDDNQRFVERLRCVDAPRTTPHEGFDEVFESAVDAPAAAMP